MQDQEQEKRTGEFSGVMFKSQLRNLSETGDTESLLYNRFSLLTLPLNFAKSLLYPHN